MYDIMLDRLNREISSDRNQDRIFDSAVALLTKDVFYSVGLLFSALIKIHPMVKIPHWPR